jgi:rubrerythrin
MSRETTDRSMQMLKTALEMEEKGRKYYEKAAGTAHNELGREIFQMLGNYEVEHAERIQQIYESLKNGQGWKQELANFPVISDLGHIFARLAGQQKEHIRADTGDVEALGVGIDFESASIDFYEQHLSQAAEPLEKQFLKRMIEEERQHLNLLADMRMYYTDPESWLLEKSRGHLDGA